MSTEYEQDKRNVLPTESDCGEEERTYAQGMSDEEIRETLLLLRQSADSIPEDLQQKEISETQFLELTQMQEEADSENTDNDAEDVLYAEAIRLLNGSEEKNRQPDEPEKQAIKENAVKKHANNAKFKLRIVSHTLCVNDIVLGCILSTKDINILKNILLMFYF